MTSALANSKQPGTRNGADGPPRKFIFVCTSSGKYLVFDDDDAPVKCSIRAQEIIGVVSSSWSGSDSTDS